MLLEEGEVIVVVVVEPLVVLAKRALTISVVYACLPELLLLLLLLLLFLLLLVDLMLFEDGDKDGRTTEGGKDRVAVALLAAVGVALAEAVGVVAPPPPTSDESIDDAEGEALLRSVDSEGSRVVVTARNVGFGDEELMFMEVILRAGLVSMTQ